LDKVRCTIGRENPKAGRSINKTSRILRRMARGVVDLKDMELKEKRITGGQDRLQKNTHIERAQSTHFQRATPAKQVGSISAENHPP